jgi:hypothetical protein
MKKNSLIVIFLLFCAHVFAQTNLKEIIKGEKGVSKHFVTLEEKKPVCF